MQTELARFNMIAQQIRPWDVRDQQVLDLLDTIKREQFVPTAWKPMSFVDMEIPLGHDETMMSPKMEARIVQEMRITATDTVLEIGTGSGYLTALLAGCAQQVISVDIISEFTIQAAAKLLANGIDNIRLTTGDGAQGWSRNAPYQVIVLTGSTPLLPKQFLHDLTIGGRLFAIVGDSPAMIAQRITRIAENNWHTEHLFETDVRPLRNALQPERFIF